jgi:outer membrane protein TolC
MLNHKLTANQIDFKMNFQEEDPELSQIDDLEKAKIIIQALRKARLKAERKADDANKAIEFLKSQLKTSKQNETTSGMLRAKTLKETQFWIEKAKGRYPDYIQYLYDIHFKIAKWWRKNIN